MTISQPPSGLHVATGTGVHLPSQYQDQTFHVIDYNPLVLNPNMYTNVADPTHEQFLWGIDVLFMWGSRQTILSILLNTNSHVNDPEYLLFIFFDIHHKTHWFFNL